MRRHRAIVAGVAAALAGFVAASPAAELTLGAPFTDHMVLQRERPVPVWGTAGPGEHIAVAFAGQTKTATADAAGVWHVRLDPLPASAEGRTFRVRGRTELALDDVLVGEVWLCAGQSNMEIGLTRLKTAGYGSPAEKAAAVLRVEKELATTTPGLRLYRSATGAASDPQRNRWTLCEPAALADPPRRQGFSALAYFFGRELQRALQVPVGLITAAAGGTRIERWTPAGAYAALPAFAAETAVAPLMIDGVAPGTLFRTLAEPLAPFAVRGMLWYQGESNLLEVRDADRYAEKTAALVHGWRSAWREPSLPVYFVQLPGYAYSRRKGRTALTPSSLPLFREAQARALHLPHTGMAVTVDLPTGNDLHPGNKWDVADRLARLALAKTYGHPDVVWAGPELARCEFAGDTAVLTFAQAEGGLVSRDGAPLRDFAVAGADRIFVPAEARLDGPRVLVRSPAVTHPVAVRFAWDERACANLANRAGLPAAPFRTDAWPVPAGAPAAAP